jgi:5-methylcytosine-specific restriction protein B
MKREDIIAAVAAAAGVPENQLTVKERQGRQIKANALFEGGSSPSSPRQPAGVFFATNAGDLAVDGALLRMNLDVPYPEAVLALFDAAGDGRRARIFGYPDSGLASQLSKALGVDFEDVARPTTANETKAAVTLDTTKLYRAIKSFPNIVLQGPPGTGKSSLAIELVRELVSAVDVTTVDQCRFGNLLKHAEGDLAALIGGAGKALNLPVVWEMVQLHPGYGYDDLVRRVSPVSDGGELQFVVEDRLLPKLCALAEARGGNKPVILILDELNRCNLSATLGEFIFAIDPGHRSTPVRLQYQGAGLKPSVAVPPNLWIIGTMNTADRSIALVDYAIRRRFRFIDVPADIGVVADWYASRPEMGAIATEIFEAVNSDVAPNVRVGHSAFLIDPLPDDNWPARFARQVAYHVAPLLLEYVREGLKPPGPLQWQALELDLAGAREMALQLENAIAARL